MPAASPIALLAGSWLPGRADVFAHGERESMKAVRAALHGLATSQLGTHLGLMANAQSHPSGPADQGSLSRADRSRPGLWCT